MAALEQGRRQKDQGFPVAGMGEGNAMKEHLPRSNQLDWRFDLIHPNRQKFEIVTCDSNCFQASRFLVLRHHMTSDPSASRFIFLC